jgi:hypothetical protein
MVNKLYDCLESWIETVQVQFPLVFEVMRGPKKFESLNYLHGALHGNEWILFHGLPYIALGPSQRGMSCAKLGPNETYVTSHNDISTGDQTSLYKLTYQKSPYCQTNKRSSPMLVNARGINNGTKNPHMGIKIVIVVEYCCLVGKGWVCLSFFFFLFFFFFFLVQIENSIAEEPKIQPTRAN